MKLRKSLVNKTFSLNRNSSHISKSFLHKWVQLKHNKYFQEPGLIWGKRISCRVADAFTALQLLGSLSAYCTSTGKEQSKAVRYCVTLLALQSYQVKWTKLFCTSSFLLQGFLGKSTRKGSGIEKSSRLKGEHTSCFKFHQVLSLDKILYII